VLVESGHEDQCRRHIPALEQPPCHLEPAQARHLDVEEHDIRLMSVDGLERLDAVCGLANDLHIPDLVELVAQLLAGQLLIVHDEDSEGLSHAVICWADVNSGTSMRALVPRPGSLVSRSWY